MAGGPTQPAAKPVGPSLGELKRLDPLELGRAGKPPSQWSAVVAPLFEAKEEWRGRDISAMQVIDGELAGVTFSLGFETPALTDSIFLMFGGADPRIGQIDPMAAITASIRTSNAPHGWGLLAANGSAGLPVDGREFRFAVSFDQGPFDAITHGTWTLLSFRGSGEPLIAFDDDVVMFRTDGDWQKAIVIYLFCRLQRARADVIFLHAGSLAIDGRGILFIGPKGSGKSTVTMALAARGHRFLGDECGAYVPLSRSLLPFRRPVGIKPGPRARAITAALHAARRVVQGEGFIRVPLEDLIEIDSSADPVLLDSVVFLRGFQSSPSIAQIEPGRFEVCALQPIAGSLINAPDTKRVFQLVDMLANVRVFALNPGEPDATALYLEEVFCDGSHRA